MGREYCVYVHINKINHKKYFGITCQKPQNRWSSYRKTSLIRRAFAKYGRENFDSKVIVQGLTKEDAESLEIYFIATYRSLYNEWGYNIEHGGSAPGKMDDSQKKRCSEVFKEYYSDVKHREENSKRMKEYWEKHYKYMYSTSQSEQAKEKRTQSINRVYAETNLRQKLSKGLVERWSNPAYKEKMSEHMKEYDWNNIPVCCDGKEYKSIAEFSRTFGLCGATVQTWLDGSRCMPEEWFDKGLRYRDKENVAKRRSSDGKYKIEIDGKYFTKICDLAEYLGLVESTVNRYINGKRKCPQYLLDRGLKY